MTTSQQMKEFISFQFQTLKVCDETSRYQGSIRYHFVTCFYATRVDPSNPTTLWGRGHRRHQRWRHLKLTGAEDIVTLAHNHTSEKDHMLDKSKPQFQPKQEFIKMIHSVQHDAACIVLHTKFLGQASWMLVFDFLWWLVKVPVGAIILARISCCDVTRITGVKINVTWVTRIAVITFVGLSTRHVGPKHGGCCQNLCFLVCKVIHIHAAKHAFCASHMHRTCILSEVYTLMYIYIDGLLACVGRQM